MAGDRLDQSSFGGRKPFQVNAVSRLAPGGNVGDLLAKDEAQNHRHVLAEPTHLWRNVLTRRQRRRTRYTLTCGDAA